VADYVLTLATLVALLIGLAVGKAWERYKLQDGRWMDRRKQRASPHYLQGLNFLVANPLDPAIEEFGRAASLDDRALDVPIILGNLYREKGQVGRAIQVHQQLLQRPRLSRSEHASVLLCLGLDFKRAGFVDRAIEAFGEVLRLDPDNPHALVNLEKMHEDQQQWGEAFRVRERLAARAPAEQRARHRSILAFLQNEMGLQAMRGNARQEARLAFESAIELDPSVVPAHLNLGDLLAASGDLAGAAATWERAVQVAPERAYLAFDRLRAVYGQLGTPERFPELCRRLIGSTPNDWRARLALARHLYASDRPVEAMDPLLEALTANPHAVSVHETIWRVLSRLRFEPALVERYLSVSREAVFYQDPHVCLKCHYRSTEFLWQCPHCHEWNSFVEERLTAASEDADMRSVGQD
jgi:lipopolysaccharide biosynthesis regulator YciM